MDERQTDKAFEDTETIFYLSDSLKEEPRLFPHIFRIASWNLGLQVVWEGLAEDRWSDAQLAALQKDLANADFLQGLGLALRGERASLNATVAQMQAHPALPANSGEGMSLKRSLPNGIFEHMQLDANQYYEKYLFTIVDPSAHRLRKDVIEAGDAYIEGFLQHRFFGLRLVNFYHGLTAIMAPATSVISLQTARTQATTDEALVACTLQRYRTANGRFPDALGQLVPTYLPAIPLDVLHGEEPRYHLNPDGTYLLYLKGWDGNDNGGKLIMKPGTQDIDFKKKRLDLV